MPQTPSQTDVYTTALDIFDKTHPLRVDADENLKVTGSFTTLPSGTQDVNITGTAINVPVAISQTGTNNVVRELNIDKNFGVWGYYAGLSGTVVVASGQRILGMAAHATTAATVTINGGPTITIPAGVSWELEPFGNLVAPTVIFTGTDTYMIEVVS